MNILPLDKQIHIISSLTEGCSIRATERLGEQYIFTALDPVSRCLLAFHIGKRDLDNTLLFMTDLRSRIFNRPQISTDAFAPYTEAIAATFGTDVDYAQIVKPPPDDISHRPGWHRSSRFWEKFGNRTIWGNPDPRRISTSLIERSNLTARQHSRRLTRMTNGFSKNFESHVASMRLTHGIRLVEA